MPKLRVLSGQDVCKILEHHGFSRMRQTGSHIILKKQLPDRSITVPIPNHTEISRGTLKNIISQSEISRNLFMTS